MARKPRIDSQAGALQIIERMKAMGDITVPAHVPLTPSAVVHFEQIVKELPRSEWTEHTLALAAMLARDCDMLEQLQREIALEGVAIENTRGAQIINPKVTAANALRSSILALRRSLSLHVKIKGGNLHRTARARAVAMQIEQQFSAEDDGLFQ